LGLTERGGGDTKNGVINVCCVELAAKSSLVPSVPRRPDRAHREHELRMRAAGRDHGIENAPLDVRLDLAAEPRMKRPSEPLEVVGRHRQVIGVRANATAIDVPSSMRSVCSAAISHGRNGS
jgi:hypothetical protein